MHRDQKWILIVMMVPVDHQPVHQNEDFRLQSLMTSKNRKKLELKFRFQKLIPT